MMKTLHEYLSHGRVNAKYNRRLSLLQSEIGGGIITRGEIDEIQRHPEATEIEISGLRQETFEYFIVKYGDQFDMIYIWKCPLIEDLQPLESLQNIKYLLLFWNQRATKLWDLSLTSSLKGIALEDFSRLHDLTDFVDASSLEELRIGDAVWPGIVINTLEPLQHCQSLRYLSIGAKKLIDDRIQPLAALQRLEQLYLSDKLFTTEQITWLKAHLPAHVVSPVFSPYIQLSEPSEYSGKDINITGKRKPWLNSIRDKTRIERYAENYNRMYQWYLAHPQASPDDYPG